MVLPLHDDNPTERPPIVTVGLIVLCVLIFLWQWLTPSVDSIGSLGVIPASLLGRAELHPDYVLVPPTMTLFTSMFLHGGFLHLLFNMLYLWIFGNNVEDSMGHVRFVIFYLICGVAAVYAQALPEPDSTTPMVGASGAISGVLGAYMLLYPHARVLLGLPIGFLIVQLGRFPAGWVLASWFVLQLISNQFAAAGGGVAFRAHIGGFVAGMALIPLFKRRDVPLWRPKR
jgi:membrane associated rhomboid family serine protease